MRLVVTRLRSLLIPCTLALIFGTLLFQTDRALMKGGEKQRLFTSTTPQSTATNSQTKISGSTFKTASSNTTPAANAFFAPIISAGKSVNLSSASPGATLNYTITIGNSGTTATTGVLFSDTIDANTTLVPGSVNTSPLALTDSYACTGNVGISVPAASGVLINDFDPDGTIPAIVGVNTAGTQGTVSLNPGNGSFTFNPAPGFEGTTTFSYTLSDGVFSDIGTVSITVSGMIWFIDDSVAGPGDGRLSAPFNSVANFNSLAADDPGDNIFVYSGSYSGATTLLNNQKLIGQGATASLVSLAGLTLPPFSNALPATAGTRPTITNSATVLTLGQGNLIRGFNVTNSAGVGISGNNFGTLAASEISVTSTTCSAAVNLTNGNPTASFTSISANNCTNGIILDTLNAAGSFTITGTGTAGSGGTIQNTTGGDSLTGAAGIRMNSVSNVSFNRMQINDHSNYGIRGNSVTNMTLADSVLNGNNGTSTSSAFREGALSIVNLLGSCSFTNTNFSGGSMHTMYIENTGGTLNRLTVDTCTVASTRAGSDDAFQFRPSAGTPT
nr:cadherin-like domain-containing protein [Acidobacteriota bacterium]